MSEQAATIRVVIKPTAGGDKIQLNIDPNTSILEVKEELAKQCTLAASEQRLIYKGQILKDERTLDSYGIGNDHVVHLVRGKPQSTTPSTGSAAATGTGTTTTASTGLPVPGADTLDPMMGMLGGNPQQMQQMMSEMMSSPIFQSIMNNPELVRTMLQSNPQVRQVMDANPELAQLLNNPQILQETMRVMSNPSLMREHMRTADRQMSNIEALPEGFNTLRRLYESVQEPLMNATTNPSPATNPLASLFNPPRPQNTTDTQAETQPGTSPNSNPLPNPWAPPPSATQTGTGTAPASTAPAGLGGLGLGLGLGLPGAGGAGAGGLGAMPDMTQAMQMLQNPAIQEMMSTMMAQPGMMESMINMNPQLRSLIEANPELRDQMANPDLLRQMLSPQNMQAIMQLQQAMQTLQGSGLFPTLGGPAGAGGPDLQAMLNGMGGMGGMGGLGGLGSLFGGGVPAPAPVADPESAYSTQIQQLTDMGFYDREANIRALQATGGNVNAAVERLLSGL